MNITFKIVENVVRKRNEKGTENPYMVYNIFGLSEIYNDAVENFFCRSHSDWEHNSKPHIRSKIKKSNMRQSRGNRCLHLLSVAKERTRVRNNLRRKRPDVDV